MIPNSKFFQSDELKHDLNSDFNPRFLRRYANLANEVNKAVTSYINDVKTKKFPNENEEYH